MCTYNKKHEEGARESHCNAEEPIFWAAWCDAMWYEAMPRDYHNNRRYYSGGGVDASASRSGFRSSQRTLDALLIGRAGQDWWLRVPITILAVRALLPIKKGGHDIWLMSANAASRNNTFAPFKNEIGSVLSVDFAEWKRWIDERDCNRGEKMFLYLNLIRFQGQVVYELPLTRLWDL